MQILKVLLGRLFYTRDYELPTLERLEPISLSINKHHAVLTAIRHRGDCKKEQQFVVLRPRTNAANRLLHQNVLPECHENFAEALESLTNFMHAKKPFWVKHVSNRDKSCHVLIEVEYFDQELSQLTEQDELDDESCALAQRLRLCRELSHAHIDCYFNYNIEYGPVVWLKILQSNERGNRFPKDERQFNVLRYPTLELFLKHSESF